MKAVKLLIPLLILGGHASAQITPVETEQSSQATVMWGLSGVLPRDRAHWIRNFDYFQKVPGIATTPLEVIPEEPTSRFQPEDLRQLASLCDQADCRFFFVIEVEALGEQLHSFKEGKRISYQQQFNQMLSLTAYRKAPESNRWEKIQPVRGAAQVKDMVGTAELPKEERTQNINRQRCEFLRKVPAQTAADLVGRMLVDIKGRVKSGEQNAPDILEYQLVNRSPLPLSTLYIWVPVQTGQERREQSFIHGGTLTQVGTLAPYETQTASTPLDLKWDGKPLVNQAWITIDGWSQEELDNRKSRRKGLRIHRTGWQEHENLPPPAHKMKWDTEEGEL